MLLNLLPKFRNSFCLINNYSTSFSMKITDSVTENEVDIRNLFPPKYKTPRQIWLESLDTIDEKKLGILELHPEIFAANPRIDIIHQNVCWQSMYRFVSYANTKLKFEVRGGGKKPWPQKGCKGLTVVLQFFKFDDYRFG